MLTPTDRSYFNNTTSPYNIRLFCLSSPSTQDSLALASGIQRMETHGVTANQAAFTHATASATSTPHSHRAINTRFGLGYTPESTLMPSYPPPVPQSHGPCPLNPSLEAFIMREATLPQDPLPVSGPLEKAGPGPNNDESANVGQRKEWTVTQHYRYKSASEI